MVATIQGVTMNITKQFTLFILLIACLLNSLAHAKEQQSKGVKTIKHQFKSKAAKQTISFNVILPWAYNKKQKYPVLYTTSGGSRIDMLTYQTDWLSHVEMGPMPAMIIVQLPQLDVESTLHPKFVSASGVASPLTLNVLKNELIPFIDKTYLANDFKVLEGYSSNGNFVLYAFEQSPTLFNGFIASSPALELDKSGLVERLPKLKYSDQYQDRFLYLSLGSFVNNAPLFENIKANFTQQAFHARFANYSQYNFLSVASLSLTDAMEYLFADKTPEIAQFANSGRQSVIVYFEKLSEKYQQTLSPNPSLIDLSFYYVEHKQGEKAVSTMQYLVNSHPENTFYLSRLAKVYEQLGETEKSRLTLQQGVKLATKLNNEDALTYFKGELSKL